MQFLVHIQVDMSPDIDPDLKTRLFAAERARARELADEGTLLRLWRIPGRTANWGLWEVADATALHEALTSLPLFPYLDIEVQPLAQHPSDPAAAS